MVTRPSEPLSPAAFRALPMADTRYRAQNPGSAATGPGPRAPHDVPAGQEGKRRSIGIGQEHVEAGSPRAVGSTAVDPLLKA